MRFRCRGDLPTTCFQFRTRVQPGREPDENTEPSGYAGMEEEEEYEEEVRERRRSRQPRFGSFVTIAIALLMLFGAASRMGKLPETAALFNFDNNVNERLRRERDRSNALISLGATQVQHSDLHSGPGSLPIRPVSQPPIRGDFDIDIDGRQPRSGSAPMSISIPVDDFPGDEEDDGYVPYGMPTTPQPRSPVAPPPERTAQQQTYVVREGDTLAKIAQRTLGDSNRWRELQQANPVTQNGGFRVGITLIIPQGGSAGRR